MKLVHILFLVSALLLLVALGVAYVQLAEHDALLILHFDTYRGIDFLGSRADVFNIILVGFGVSLLNYLIARGLRHKDVLLSQILAGSSIFFSLLICIAVFVIIGVN